MFFAHLLQLVGNDKPVAHPTWLVQQLKLYAALFLFQTGQLSRGAACELAGTDIYSFLAACKQYQIPVINYPAEDLAADLARFNERHSQ